MKESCLWEYLCIYVILAMWPLFEKWKNAVDKMSYLQHFFDIDVTKDFSRVMQGVFPSQTATSDCPSQPFTALQWKVFFFCQGFLHWHWRFKGQQGKEGDHLLFHSTTSTRSLILRHLFATLHVRWLSRIFNRSACVYQSGTRWDLPPYRTYIDYHPCSTSERTNQVC